MSKILRVNLSAKEIKFEDVPDKYAALGGRALTSQLITMKYLLPATPLALLTSLQLRPACFREPTHPPRAGFR